MRNSFPVLPTELWVNIANSLDKQDLYELSLVSKNIYVLLKSNWDNFVKQEFRFCPMDLLNDGLNPDTDELEEWKPDGVTITELSIAKQSLLTTLYRKCAIIFQDRKDDPNGSVLSFFLRNLSADTKTLQIYNQPSPLVFWSRSWKTSFPFITHLTLTNLSGNYYLGSSSNDAGEYNMIDAVNLSKFFPSLTYLKIDHLHVKKSDLQSLTKPLFYLKKLDIVNLWLDEDMNVDCGNDYGWNGRCHFNKLHLIVSPTHLEKLNLRYPIISEFRQRWMPTLTCDYFFPSKNGTSLPLQEFVNVKVMKFKSCLPFDVSLNFLSNLKKSLPSLEVLYIQELPASYKQQHPIADSYDRIFEKGQYDFEVRKYNSKNFFSAVPLYIEQESEYLCHCYYKHIPIRSPK